MQILLLYSFHLLSHAYLCPLSFQIWRILSQWRSLLSIPGGMRQTGLMNFLRPSHTYEVTSRGWGGKLRRPDAQPGDLPTSWWRFCSVSFDLSPRARSELLRVTQSVTEAIPAIPSVLPTFFGRSIHPLVSLAVGAGCHNPLTIGRSPGPYTTNSDTPTRSPSAGRKEPGGQGKHPWRTIIKPKQKSTHEYQHLYFLTLLNVLAVCWKYKDFLLPKIKILLLFNNIILPPW